VSLTNSKKVSQHNCGTAFLQYTAVNDDSSRQNTIFHVYHRAFVFVNGGDWSNKKTGRNKKCLHKKLFFCVSMLF